MSELSSTATETAAHENEIANAHEGTQWRDYALGVIREIAARGQSFTTDDVMEALAVQPHEPRAVGPAIKAAVAEGVIVFTGEYRPSRRRHCAPIRVWKGK